MASSSSWMAASMAVCQASPALVVISVTRLSILKSSSEPPCESDQGGIGVPLRPQAMVKRKRFWRPSSWPAFSVRQAKVLAGVLSTGPISALLLSVPPPSLPWQTRQLRAKMCAPRSASRSKTSLAASVRRPLSNQT